MLCKYSIHVNNALWHFWLFWKMSWREMKKMRDDRTNSHLADYFSKPLEQIHNNRGASSTKIPFDYVHHIDIRLVIWIIIPHSFQIWRDWRRHFPILIDIISSCFIHNPSPILGAKRMQVIKPLSHPKYIRVFKILREDPKSWLFSILQWALG